jgi:hypothetical protein
MKNLIKKILKEEFEDFDWIKDQNPEPWEEFIFRYIDLTPKLENTKHGIWMVYRDENGEWVFLHKQNPKNRVVWFNYSKIWSVFENKFGFNYKETEEFLESWLGEHYNLRRVTAKIRLHYHPTRLREHYNLEVGKNLIKKIFKE